MNCTREDKYLKDERCCDKCPAGSYVRAECDNTKKTECGECGRGFFTATKNYMFKCLACRNCSLEKNRRKVKDCDAHEDTVCECETGFFCKNDQCDHCQKVKTCGLGQGVKAKATRTNDTMCADCEKGTFSNVTDFHSACQTHTRCEDLGRVLKTLGTPKADAICGNFISDCRWIIPAGLWSGLVLTVLVLFGLICWRSKRKSCRSVNLCANAGIYSKNTTASPGDPVTYIEMIPADPVSPLKLPLPSNEQNGHCPESYMEEGCKLPLFTTDDNVCTEDSVDSSLPITPLKASVSFAESSQGNGSAGYCTANLLRTYSEPQEDEWCGTEGS
ncbi:tumor necrosis factor receptor superfamily member 5 isoform X1 [Labrus mixtus]|uniref:tumor necrosis factor receptor superfamily member 5 isoform X1 n=1 Tax=Labrus mixtus TaxID=508554 RepID=UPI0029C04265|nr:tumor necrosis factor receptor superfamily member 5 isoform X1 [Labrus mixtus]